MKTLQRRYLSLVLLAVVMVYGVVNAYTLQVKEVTIPVFGLSKPIRAVHLTDIHLGNFRGKKYLEKVVDKTISLKPDVVFNTGDLFDSKAHFYTGTDVLDPFKKIEVPHYFVDGNHDEYVGADQVFELTRKAGLINLQNKLGNYGELQLVGLNNMAQDSISFDLHTPPGSKTIKDVLDKLLIDKNKPTLVMHHRPVGEKYMQKKGIDVLLAGHTHAGQMFPFTLIARALFPYLKGLYHYQDMSIYVSQGQGTIFVPFRIGTVSEITVVNLVPKND
ncbi:MAG: metallophosphoesterase [Breznakibacter sp.]